VNKAETMSEIERYSYIKARLEQPVDPDKPLHAPIREMMTDGFTFDEIFAVIFPPPGMRKPN
jgi:hypothetical protein